MAGQLRSLPAEARIQPVASVSESTQPAATSAPTHSNNQTLSGKKRKKEEDQEETVSEPPHSESAQPVQSSSEPTLAALFAEHVKFKKTAKKLLKKVHF